MLLTTIYLLLVKYIYLASVMQGLILSGSVRAQTPLSAEEHALHSGDRLVRQQVDFFGAGSSGAGMVWDFSMAGDVSIEYTTEYIGENDSVVIEANPHSIRKHVQRNDSLFLYSYSNRLYYIEYSTPILETAYPMIYGDTLYSAYSGRGLYCGKKAVWISGEAHVSADAYGTLVFPGGDTLRNVVRVYTLRTSSLRMSDGDIRAGEDDRKLCIEENYKWYVRGYRYPAMETVSESYYDGTNRLNSAVIFDYRKELPFTLPQGMTKTEFFRRLSNSCMDYGAIDFAPDLFTYVIPGYTGGFIFSHDHSILKEKFDNVVITPVRNMGKRGIDYLSSFVLTDPDGNKSDVRRTYSDGVAVVTSTEYSFTDKPLEIRYTLYTGGGIVSVTVENTYGPTNDLLVSSVLKANGTEVNLGTNEYDVLGRLSKVSRGGNSLSQQYDYNIRGWLTQIVGNGFRETLSYTDGSTPCYNGNISRMAWDGNGPYPACSSYDFSYDGLDRLVSARYVYRMGDAEKEFDNSEYLTYNSNGSPLTLKRYGRYSTGGRLIGYGLVNDLSFIYSGNRVTGISDTGISPSLCSPYVFHGNPSGSGYSYNANGALTCNPDKHIGLVEYDTFTNPRLIQFTNGSVTEYVYGVSGGKLKTVRRTAVPGMEVPNGTVYAHTSATVLNSDSTLYAGPFLLSGSSVRYQYDGGSVLLLDDSTSVPKPYFYALDHLGSVRVVISGDGQVLERNDYYPSGCLMSTTGSGSTAQPYKYTGKELDPMHGLYTYDYGARQYDAAIMMWDRMDPLCEKYYNVSPYVYCHNNPINKIDIDGKDDYYSQLGYYLYSDNKETDNIIIRNQALYEVKTKYNIDWAITDTPLSEADLSAEAYSNILTDILSKMEGVNTMDLHNGKVSITVWEKTENIKTCIDYFNDAKFNGNTLASIGLYKGKQRLMVYIFPKGDKNREVYSTVSNVQNILGVHEYMGHFKSGMSDHKEYI